MCALNMLLWVKRESNEMNSPAYGLNSQPPGYEY